MVVEDEGIVALDIRSKLEGKGYEVPAVFSTGEEAVAGAGEFLPDLVLMDIQLAGEMDGTQAAEQIHARYNIPVVYLTAFSDDKTLNRAKAAEPFGYMLKPFEEKKLHATIEIALYKHQIDTEKAQLETQLAQARKMEAIGRLTAGIAYNFTNMLQGIQGNIDLALFDASDEMRPLLDAADFDAQRAAQLLKQLMSFYQREQLDYQPLAIATLIDEVTSMCRDVFARSPGRTVDIQTECQPELPTIRGDQAQLRQCLASLCTNARDALDTLPTADKRRPVVTVSAAAIALDQVGHLPHGTDGDQQYVHISISDNGPGLDAESQEHIFEPFFTDKESDINKGLGLAITYSLIREHHGWIECKSTAGAGTTFSLFLPAQSSESSETQPQLPAIITSEEAIFDTEALRGDEKILIIADVDRFRKMLSEMLERHGYNVHLGFDVRDGLSLFEMDRDNIDLVVLDLSMPDISSEEVLGELLALHPAVNVLVVTGYTTDSAPWQGAKAVLNKPFKTYHLLRTIRRVLAAE